MQSSVFHTINTKKNCLKFCFSCIIKKLIVFEMILSKFVRDMKYDDTKLGVLHDASTKVLLYYNLDFGIREIDAHIVQISSRSANLSAFPARALIILLLDHL